MEQPPYGGENRSRETVTEESNEMEKAESGLHLVLEHAKDPATRGLARGLLEAAELVRSGKEAVLRKWEQVGPRAMLKPLPNPVMAKERGDKTNYMTFISHLSYAQQALANALDDLGMQLIVPRQGDLYDPARHTFRESDLVWINDDPSLDNQVASLTIAGVQDRDNPAHIVKAVVRRYVYQGAEVSPAAALGTPPTLRAEVIPSSKVAPNISNSPVHTDEDFLAWAAHTPSVPSQDRVEPSTSTLSPTGATPETPQGEEPPTKTFEDLLEQATRTDKL